MSLLAASCDCNSWNEPPIYTWLVLRSISFHTNFIFSVESPFDSGTSHERERERAQKHGLVADQDPPGSLQIWVMIACCA